MSRSALVTGANGFVGGALIHRLIESGYTVTPMLRDPQTNLFPDEKKISDLLNSVRPQILVHAAGTSSVADSFQSHNTDFEASVGLTSTLLEGIRASSVRPLVAYVSSAAVYGNPSQVPTPENAPLHPISPYGRHKAACEALLSDYARTHKISSLALRVFSLFGSHQRKLLIWDLYRKARDPSSNTLRVSGSGKETRDFLHVDDLACLILRLMEAVPTDGTFRALNVGSGQRRSIANAAEEMLKVTSSNKELIFLNEPQNGNPPYWGADLTEMKKLLPNFAPPTFKERLEQCVQQWDRELLETK